MTGFRSTKASQERHIIGRKPANANSFANNPLNLISPFREGFLLLLEMNMALVDAGDAAT
jgi:hypothetical protein